MPDDPANCELTAKCQNPGQTSEDVECNLKFEGIDVKNITFNFTPGQVGTYNTTN